jgi:hypothetical protein
MALQTNSLELTIASGSTYSNNLTNINATYGGNARYLQINNFDPSNSVKVQLNGSAIITIPAQCSQVFTPDSGLEFESIGFDYDGSGSSIAVEVIFGVAISL